MNKSNLCWCILLVSAVATAWPTEALAQSCNGAIGGGPLMHGPYRPGDTVRVQQLVGALDIGGGSSISIPTAEATLDCVGPGDICVTGCTDSGAEASYVGDATLANVSCEDANGNLLNIVSNNPAGGTVPNQLVFTFVDGDGNPTPAVVNAFNVCEIQYDVQVLSYSGGGADNSTLFIEFDASFEGATCDNGLDGSACGTRAIHLQATCDAKVDKQVSCDGGTTWHDPGLDTCTLTDGVADDPDVQGCTSTNDYDADGDNVPDGAQPVLVRYYAENTSDDVVTLTNCVLEDSNTGILPAPLPVGDITVGDGMVLLTGPISIDCTESLDDLEPNTAILTCDCAVDGTCEDPPDHHIVDPAGEPTCEAADCDVATFDCVTPGLSVEKLCTDDESADITITVTNTGDADLVNCQVTDVIFLDDDTCPPDTGLGMGVSVTPSMFDLPAGGQPQEVTGSAGPLTFVAANSVSVTCQIADAFHQDGTQKTITAGDCDECGVELCDLTLCKEDTNGQPLEGVGLEATGPEGTLTCVTDQTGCCPTFTDIECGTYDVAEPTPPEGYAFERCDPDPVVITPDAPGVVTCTNRPLCDLTLCKQDPDGQPLEGVDLEATGPEGTLTCTTGADGCCTFTDIECGTYDVAEPTPPDGYTFEGCDPDPVVITPDAPGFVTCTNRPLCDLTLCKEDTNGQPLEGVDLEATGPEGTLTCTTGADGCCPTFTDIECGTYDVAEPMPPAGYSFVGCDPDPVIVTPDTPGVVTCVNEPEGNEGCTPGYWKLIDDDPANASHQCYWEDPYDPDDLFSATCANGVCFEDAFPGKTLIEVLNQDVDGIPQLRVLGFHTVAALLNAASADVNYAIATPQEVIEMFNDVFPGDKADYVALKSMFAGYNEAEEGCPLGNCFFNDGDGVPPVQTFEDTGGVSDTGIGEAGITATRELSNSAVTACGAAGTASLAMTLIGLVGLRLVRGRRE